MVVGYPRHRCFTNRLIKMKNINKKYKPEIENKWYEYWTENNFFKSDPDEREPYTIIMPPPNITGILHIGHLLNITLQDILIRKARLQGKNACFIPGLDHAALATEIKITEDLKERGINKDDLTKEEFLEHCWEWKNNHQDIIISQLKKLGCSADWTRLIFTMDQQHQDKIYEIYDKLKDDKLIYKATKTLNYDPLMKTNISEHEIKTIKKDGQLIEISDRSKAEIEKIESEQLFLKLNEISKPAIDKIEDGTIKMIPDNQFKSYKNWFDELQDWCISRQTSWGHNIPDTDFTFDTWFSSWLWGYSIFKNKEDFDYYFPSNIIITGYDIAFFWIAKMIMATYYTLDEKPFDNIYFTGLIRDKYGRKISKQFGNSPDILKLIDLHGADSTRFSTIINHQAGLDSKWSEELIMQGKKFCNKMWNAQKLILSWTSADIEMSTIQQETLSKFEIILEERLLSIDDDLEKYRFSESLTGIYKLIWDDFCSFYLENIKPDTDNYPGINKELLDRTIESYEKMLKSLHPFMPFITEEIWNNIDERKDGDTIMF